MIGTHKAFSVMRLFLAFIIYTKIFIQTESICKIEVILMTK